jgi:hypothetical protein
MAQIVSIAASYLAKVDPLVPNQELTARDVVIWQDYLPIDRSENPRL